MRFAPVSKRRVPTRHEQLEALVEILESPRALAQDVVEGFGDEINARPGLPIDHPNPQRLYPANGVHLVRNPALAVPACAIDGVVHLRPDCDVRHLAFLAAHELAEELLRRSRWIHLHGDVQRLACAILVPASVAVPLLRRLGFWGALHHIARRHRHCPGWVIEYRLYTLAVARDEESAAVATA